MMDDVGKTLLSVYRTAATGAVAAAAAATAIIAANDADGDARTEHADEIARPRRHSFEDAFTTPSGAGGGPSSSSAASLRAATSGDREATATPVDDTRESVTPPFVTANDQPPPKPPKVETDEEIARRLTQELNASGRRRRPPAPTYVPAPLHRAKGATVVNNTKNDAGGQGQVAKNGSSGAPSQTKPPKKQMRTMDEAERRKKKEERKAVKKAAKRAARKAAKEKQRAHTLHENEEGRIDDDGMELVVKEERLKEEAGETSEEEKDGHNTTDGGDGGETTDTTVEDDDNTTDEDEDEDEDDEDGQEEEEKRKKKRADGDAVINPETPSLQVMGQAAQRRSKYEAVTPEEYPAGTLVWSMIRGSKKSSKNQGGGGEGLWWPGRVWKLRNCVKKEALWRMRGAPATEPRALVQCFGDGSFVWCAPDELSPYTCGDAMARQRRAAELVALASLTTAERKKRNGGIRFNAAMVKRALLEAEEAALTEFQAPWSDSEYSDDDDDDDENGEEYHQSPRTGGGIRIGGGGVRKPARGGGVPLGRHLHRRQQGVHLESGGEREGRGY